MLSIIIPAYNAASHISRCLDSIINSIKQLPQDVPVEIIVVNDGSKDNTTEIVGAYQAVLGKRLVLINKSNEGVSSARNCGINEARGEYLYFMDSDDEISSSFFPLLLPILAQKSSDVFVFGFTLVSGNKKRDFIPKQSQDLLSKYLEGKRRVAIWSIVCNRHIFDTIRFDEHTFFGEDIEVVSKVLFHANKIEVISDSLYSYYSDNPYSAMHNKVSEKNLTSIAAHIRIYEYMISMGASKRTINAAKNLMLTIYYRRKNRVIKSQDKELLSKLRCYAELERIHPAFQLSKYYLYSIVNHFKNKMISN